MTISVATCRIGITVCSSCHSFVYLTDGYSVFRSVSVHMNISVATW